MNGCRKRNGPNQILTPELHAQAKLAQHAALRESPLSIDAGTISGLELHNLIA